jgi:RNA polymerase sigma-70 factor (ECF subfamily)
MAPVETFLAALPPGVQAPDPGRLEPLLQAAAAQVRGEVDRGRLSRILARVMRPGEDPLQVLGTLHVSDLWLADRAAAGEPASLAELDHKLDRAVRAAVSRIRPDAAFLDEVAQTLRSKLLLAEPGGTPKLLDFAGRGALARWLEAAALRVALTLRAKDRPGHVGDGALEAVEAPQPGPDTVLVRGRLGPELQRALEEVLTALPVRERNLLRLYFVQGLTVEEIGRLEGTHKSTVSRWLARVRAGTLAQVRSTLVQRLGLSAGELDSVLAELKSQLHLSVSRVLGPRT